MTSQEPVKRQKSSVTLAAIFPRALAPEGSLKEYRVAA